MPPKSTLPKHPARFSKGIVEIAAVWIERHAKGRDAHDPIRVLDPFAGVGGVHQLQVIMYPRVLTTGVEIEKVWADTHERTIHGNALKMRFPNGYFQVIFTSPTYGNRLADKHTVQNERQPWVRRSYTHDLREATGDPDADLDPDNSGRLQWGKAYKNFHIKFMEEAYRVLMPGGLFILNVSDHVRARQVIPVCGFWTELMAEFEMKCIERETIETRRMKFGKNHEARVDHEMLYCFRKKEIE